MTGPSNMIPVKVWAHSQLWANCCNNQFVRNRTGWEACFPLYRKKTWLQSKSHWKIHLKFLLTKNWVTSRGTKTVQPKRLQRSYVKILFSVATKMLTRMWMSLSSCGNCRHVWFPGVHCQSVPVYREQSPSPSVGSLTALWSIESRGPAPGPRHDSPTQQACRSFWKPSVSDPRDWEFWLRRSGMFGSLLWN